MPQNQQNIPDADVSQVLIERGWVQGSLFTAPVTRSWATGLDSKGEAGLVSMETPSNGQFIVVSQTCDIAAPLTTEPVVEAMPCSVETDRSFRAKARRSRRWFDVQTDDMFIHAMYRTSFHKRLLLQLDPTMWPGSGDRQRNFSIWLGRRLTRPAIDDPIVQSFCKPLQSIIGKLESKNSEIGTRFNIAVREIRIGLPPEPEPPFTINLFLLLNPAGVTSEGADAIDEVILKLRNKLSPDQAVLENVGMYEPETLSLALYENTMLIDFDSITYGGEDTVGAEPFSF